MTAPVALKALSGTDASIEDVAPFAQTTTLHVCWAAPVVMNVPNGRSTCTVGFPEESNRIQTLASGVPSRFASTVIEKPSLATLFLLLVRVSSQRTYTLPSPEVIRTAVMSVEPPPASAGLSGKDGVVVSAVQSAMLPSIQILRVAVVQL